MARVNGEPLITSEVVVVAPFPLRSTGTDANVQVRGVSPNVLTVRRNVKIIEGRMFRPAFPNWRWAVTPRTLTRA